MLYKLINLYFDELYLWLKILYYDVIKMKMVLLIDVNIYYILNINNKLINKW